MDLKSSQNFYSLDKKKIPDDISLKTAQMNAIIDQKNIKTRKFKHETVTIETIFGTTLETKMWTTDEEYKSTKEREVLECEICGKKFDKIQKLNEHLNIHNEE